MTITPVESQYSLNLVAQYNWRTQTIQKC